MANFPTQNFDAGDPLHGGSLGDPLADALGIPKGPKEIPREIIAGGHGAAVSEITLGDT